MATVTKLQPNPNRPAPPAIRTPLFVVGIALALFAFVAMFGIGLILSRGSGSGAQEKVVVVTDDIAARQQLTLLDVTLVTKPASAVPPQAFTSISQVSSSMYALVSIPKGAVLTGNVVTSNPDELTATGASSYLPIPEGWVAVTIPAGELQGVGGYPAQGDYINVMVEAKKSLFNTALQGSSVVTVFYGVKVIRIGPESTGKQGVAQGVVSSFTVLMRQCDSDYMMWFVDNTTVKYSLESSADYNTPAAATACTGGDIGNPIDAGAVNARFKFWKP